MESDYFHYKEMLIENRSINRKHLLFVIPYKEHDSKHGYSPGQYYYGMLDAMEEDGVFKSKVDRISIIVTKVDRIQDKENVFPVVNDYLREKWPMIIRLEHICKEYGINGGSLSIIPFSCGESCLQDLVRIDMSYSEKLIRHLILNDIPSKSPVRRFLNILNIFRK